MRKQSDLNVVHLGLAMPQNVPNFQTERLGRRFCFPLVDPGAYRPYGYTDGA